LENLPAHLMKNIFLLVGLFATLSSSASAESYPAAAEVYFSPSGGSARAVIEQLDHAKNEVRVQAYSFTHTGIAKALVDAKQRGVDVQIILDKSNQSQKYNAADFTAHAGVPTYIDAKHAIAHNKIMVIDGETVITGSFNFTKGAEEKNAENLLVLQSKPLAQRYLQNWQRHLQHSETYVVK
jgi:phosphatidylserine/phosphatidylglycerophosphate/cardiolipin synthase-like enzyme